MMFTLMLFICLCHSSVLGFAKMQQHQIERLEGIQALLLQAPTAWRVSRRAQRPKITTHKTLLPKKFQQGNGQPDGGFPAFQYPKFCASLEQICSWV